MATGANGQWALAILLYTRKAIYIRHACRVGSRPSTAIQRIYRIQLYITIQLYIAIHDTISTSPLWSARSGPGGGQGRGRGSLSVVRRVVGCAPRRANYRTGQRTLVYTRATVRKQQSTQDWTGLERRVHILGLDDALRGGCRPRLHGAEARVRAAEAARDVGAVGVGLARRPMLLGHALPRG